MYPGIQALLTTYMLMKMHGKLKFLMILETMIILSLITLDPLGMIQLQLKHVNARVSVPSTHTFDKYKDYFLRAPTEVIKKTFDATTQYAQSGWIMGSIYDTYRSPFLVLNLLPLIPFSLTHLQLMMELLVHNFSLAYNQSSVRCMA